MKRLPQSIRKYIRRKKAEFRRGNIDATEQNDAVNRLYEEARRLYTTRT